MNTRNIDCIPIYSYIFDGMVTFTKLQQSYDFHQPSILTQLLKLIMNTGFCPVSV